MYSVCCSFTLSRSICVLCTVTTMCNNVCAVGTIAHLYNQSPIPDESRLHRPSGASGGLVSPLCRVVGALRALLSGEFRRILQRNAIHTVS